MGFERTYEPPLPRQMERELSSQMSWMSAVNTGWGRETRLSETDVERVAIAVADEMERRNRPSVLSVTTEDIVRWCPALKP